MFNAISTEDDKKNVLHFNFGTLAEVFEVLVSDRHLLKALHKKCFILGFHRWLVLNRIHSLISKVKNDSYPFSSCPNFSLNILLTVHELVFILCLKFDTKASTYTRPYTTVRAPFVIMMLKKSLNVAKRNKDFQPPWCS